MPSFWRRIVRVEPARASALALGLVLAAALAAYIYAAAISGPTTGALAAAIALLAVAASGLLYAWRPGAGGPGD
jgi:hypothetical protein